jgi:hypothetical protein
MHFIVCLLLVDPDRRGIYVAIVSGAAIGGHFSGRGNSFHPRQPEETSP